MEDDQEYVATIIGLCGRQGAGKSTVEQIICEKSQYRQKRASNRLDYIAKLLEIEKKKLLDLLIRTIDPCMKELENEGKFTVWVRDRKSLNRDMYNSISFAEPLKIVASIIFDYDFNILLGLTENQRKDREIIKTKKYSVCGEMTGRECLEVLGTNILRNNISETIWVDLVMINAEKFMNDGYSVCISDVRFKNEYQAIKDLPNSDIWIIFKNINDFEITQDDLQSHITAYNFLTFIDIDEDILIRNNETIEQLQENIYEMLDW